MSTPIAPAIIGLLGAVIGATAGLAGALGSQRLQARRARRAQVIDRFIEVVGSDPGAALTGQLAKAATEAARIGDRTMLRRWLRAEDPYEMVHALHSILLDAINTERESMSLEPLELDDIHMMILSAESHEQQRAWENGEPVPRIEPSQPTSQRPPKRRRR